MNPRPPTPSALLMLALATGVMLPASATAQSGPLAPGDAVRIQRLPGSGSRPFVGVVHETRGDSITVRSGRGAMAVFSNEIFSDPDYTVELKTGTMAGEAALGGFIIGGGLGFAFGYCFQLFGDGCARDLGEGMRGALLAGGVTALIAAGFGVLIPEFEELGSLGRATETFAARAGRSGGFELSLRLPGMRW